MPTASGPLRPSAMSTMTRWPSLRFISPARCNAEAWTNTSLPPPSRPARSGPRPGGGGGGGYDQAPLTASSQEQGTVKWYNATKGFGFVAPAEGGKDVFVHASALQRAGVMQLAEGQTIWMDVVQGAKGPEAASIRTS